MIELLRPLYVLNGVAPVKYNLLPANNVKLAPLGATTLGLKLIAGTFNVAPFFTKKETCPGFVVLSEKTSIYLATLTIPAVFIVKLPVPPEAAPRLSIEM